MISRTSIFIICLLSCATTAPAGEFIRQKQSETGLTWDYHVNSHTGSSWSPIPVARGGSSLILYAVGNQSDHKLYQLDQTTLGSHLPSASLKIKSEDPYFPTRTRADRPFTVTLHSHDRGNSSKSLVVRHQTTAYQPNTHAPASPAAETNIGWWEMSRPGVHTGLFYPGIVANDASLAEGEEVFQVYTQQKSAAGSGTNLLPLQTTRIQVWPVSTASIPGIKTGTTLSQEQISQPVKIDCQNLYPDSVTYVQIYHGTAKLGTKGTILPQSVVRFDTCVPQDQTIPLGEWSDTLADGEYTLEVVTITPFNGRKPERLAHTTFVIDRGMHAPSMVGSMTSD